MGQETRKRIKGWQVDRVWKKVDSSGLWRYDGHSSVPSYNAFGDTPEMHKCSWICMDQEVSSLSSFHSLSLFFPPTFTGIGIIIIIHVYVSTGFLWFGPQFNFIHSLSDRICLQDSQALDVCEKDEVLVWVNLVLANWPRDRRRTEELRWFGREKFFEVSE